MKRIIYKIILFTALVPASLSLASSQKLGININKIPIQLTDSAPYIDANSRTMVPIRLVSEKLGAKVDWDSSSKSFSVKAINKETRENVNISGRIGTHNFVLKNKRCYVPIRFFSNELGYKVNYQEKTVFIYEEEDLDLILEDFEKEVVRLTNLERVKLGLIPFKVSQDLSRVARIKSKDMQNFNYFDHTSPKYGSPFNMMDYFGIIYKGAGENIAKGHFTPEGVVKGWMDSPGHRDNILGSFTHLGVGYEEEGRYWTQMFKTKR